MTRHRPRIVIVGEALVDIVHRASGALDEAPGGSPANVALSLGRLGLAPTLVTRLAKDERGARVRRWLEESDVTVVAVGADRTSTATAHLDPSGAATYEFDLQWDLSVDRASVVGEIAGPVDVLHTGSIATVREPGATAVADLVRTLRPRALVTFDPNVRPSLVDDPDAARARVAQLVRLADVVKASDEDVRWLHPGRDIREMAREWKASGPALVVVTRGAEGALAVGEAAEVEVPSVRTEVVDTVGAGDTFMGALIAGLVRDGSSGREMRAAARTLGREQLERLLIASARAAAITVSRPGADPPRRHELVASR